MNRRMIPAGCQQNECVAVACFKSLDLQVKQGLCGAVLQVKAFHPRGGRGRGRTREKNRPAELEMKNDTRCAGFATQEDTHEFDTRSGTLAPQISPNWPPCAYIRRLVRSMAGGNGRGGTKRTRRHVADQPPALPPHAHHQMPMAAMPPPMQHPYPPPPPGAAVPGILPPPPPPGLMAAAWGYPGMPPPPGTLPLPPGYPTAVAPTPARPAPAAAANTAAARQVSPAIADRLTREDQSNSQRSSTARSSASSAGAAAAVGPVPVHLRAAYRTQTHACPNCSITSPSSTFTTHPGPQHLPHCPRHRHPATPAPSNHIPTSATAYTKLQSALTRELRDIKQRIVEDIEKQREEFISRLERSKRRQLEMALEANRVASAALQRVPSVAAMNNNGEMMGQGPMPHPQTQIGIMHPVPPPPPAQVQQMHPIPPPPQAPVERHEMAESTTTQANHPPAEDEESTLLDPSIPPPGYDDDDEEEDLLEPLPAAELTAHMPEPQHTTTDVGTTTVEDAAVEAVDEMIAEAGLDGDEEMVGLNTGGTTGQSLEGAEPQCVQHLVRSKKRRGSATGTGAESSRGKSAGTANATIETGAIIATAAEPAQARPSQPPAATTTTIARTLPANSTPIGPKCTQCKSSLVGGPPAAMCTSDKCRTMLCGTCLDEHKATAPDNSWCSDCGRVVNIVCRACLQGKGAASTSGTCASSAGGKNKLGSNEFLRCRAANCEQYCCPRHIRMMDCTVCGRQPFCYGHTRKCSTEGCEDCGRMLCGQWLCALKEGCVCGKRRHDPNVDWAITIMGEAKKQQHARAALEAAEQEDPVENVPAIKKRKKRGGRSKLGTENASTAGNDGSGRDTDVLQANIHKIHEILTAGDNSNSNEMAAI